MGSVLDLDSEENQRYKRELIAGIKDAIRRGYGVSAIGSILVHDPSLARKLMSGHRFKPATLHTAHANLKKLVGPPPSISLTLEMLAR